MTPGFDPSSSDSEEETDSGSARIVGLVILFCVVSSFVILRVILPGDKAPIAGDDLLEYYYPTYFSTYHQLASGSLPLWNPYQLAGLPRLGAIQGGTFYPLHFVYLLMSTSAAMTVSVLIHLGILIVSTYAFSRRIGMYWYSALFACLLLAMRGHYTNMLHFPNMLEASVWVLPGSVAILSLVRGEFARPVAFIALCTAMSVLAGYPQATVYVGYFWGALLLGLLLTRLEPPRIWLVALAGLGLAVLLGSLMAAVQLLPAFELSELGNRKIERLSVREMYPMGIRTTNFWTTLMYAYNPAADHRAPAFYFGAVGLALLPAGLLDRRRRRLHLVLCVIGILVVIASLGPVSPIFDLYRALPVLDSFRIPKRSRFIADICFAIAAAGGLDAVARALRRRADDLAKRREGVRAKLLESAPILVPLLLLPFLAWGWRGRDSTVS